MARQARKQPIDPVVAESQRLDKWLWFARVAKTRTLAATLVADGRVRVNRIRTTKPAQVVKVGDVVTVSVAGGVRVLKIVLAGSRRGPATEAPSCTKKSCPYSRAGRRKAPMAASLRHRILITQQLIQPSVRSAPARADRSATRSGRPTKKDRRTLDRLRST